MHQAWTLSSNRPATPFFCQAGLSYLVSAPSPLAPWAPPDLLLSSSAWWPLTLFSWTVAQSLSHHPQPPARASPSQNAWWSSSTQGLLSLPTAWGWTIPHGCSGWHVLCLLTWHRDKPLLCASPGTGHILTEDENLRKSPSPWSVAAHPGERDWLGRGALVRQLADWLPPPITGWGPWAPVSICMSNSIPEGAWYLVAKIKSK